MGARTRRAALVAVTATLVGLVAACGPSSSALTDIGAGLRGPSGLTATVYATGLEHASAFAFDTQGRLWVATADYEDKGTDAVYLVEKAGADPVKVIADLHTPLGLLWNKGSLYVSSKERVDAYSGLDGTEFTTQKTIVTLPAGVGEVNGLALAPDGRVLLGISAPCDHCTPESEYSGAIVSFQPDGSDLQVYTNEIRAPIGLVYYPGTSDLFVTMNHRDDLGAKTPGDWLAVVREGQAWGFPDCYGQNGDVCTGAPAPVGVLDEHAAASGVAIVTGELGDKVGTSALVRGMGQGHRPASCIDESRIDLRGSRHAVSHRHEESGARHACATMVPCSSATGRPAASTGSRRPDLRSSRGASKKGRLGASYCSRTSVPRPVPTIVWTGTAPRRATSVQALGLTRDVRASGS